MLISNEDLYLTLYLPSVCFQIKAIHTVCSFLCVLLLFSLNDKMFLIFRQKYSLQGQWHKSLSDFLTAHITETIIFRQLRALHLAPLWTSTMCLLTNSTEESHRMRLTNKHTSSFSGFYEPPREFGDGQLALEKIIKYID